MSGVVERLVQPLAVRVLLARERMESGVAYDLTSDEVREDPYPTYHELRRIDPVHRLRLVDAWVLTRYRDVEGVLRDHRRFGNAGRILVQTVPLSLLDLDPPEHTRLRALVSKAFTPKAVAMLRTHIEETTANLLDAVAGTDRFDLIAALAYPLPVTIIAEMLGVRPRDRDRFEEWSNSLALAVDPARQPRPGGSHQERRRGSVRVLRDHHRRAAPRAAGGPGHRPAGRGGGR